jgi:molecular chaperone GrpE
LDRIATQFNQGATAGDDMHRAAQGFRRAAGEAARTAQQIRQGDIRGAALGSRQVERAIQAARESQDLEGLLTGLELIDRVLQDTLGRYGVKPVQAVGRPFDPFDHEAVEMVAGEGEPAGTVLAELQRGYRFYEHLLRPARVRVVRPRQPEASGGEGEGTAPSAGGKALDIS